MSPPLPADDLIARCRRVYAECETYADEGEQHARFAPLGSPQEPAIAMMISIRTRWRRPSWMCFESRASGGGFEQGHCVAWCTPVGSWTWWSWDRHLRSVEAIEDALDLAVAPSGGASRLVPDLLRPRATPRLSFPDQGVLGEPQDVDGVACLAIPLPAGRNSSRCVWIDRNAAVVRRFDEVIVTTGEERKECARRDLARLESMPGLTDEERRKRTERLRNGMGRVARDLRCEWSTIFRPRLNVPLDDAEFEFTPPEGA